MKNPCVICLVQAGCTKICFDKEQYQHFIISQLTLFSDEYLYTGKNGRYKHGDKYVKDPSLQREHTRLLQVCEENNGEFQKIIMRGSR
jgi:hypothetical protein